jgi:ribosomal protein S3
LEQANQIRFQNLTIFQQRCLTIKLKGIKIQIKGRLNGQDRKQKISFNIGCLSLQDLNTFVDYSENKILTRYGVLGLKI